MMTCGSPFLVTSLLILMALVVQVSIICMRNQRLVTGLLKLALPPQII